MAVTSDAHNAILVCGGATVDCIVRPFDSKQRGASRTSLPGEARVGFGGVSRNIAEVITRLGGVTYLVSAVGDDDPGGQLLESCRKIGMEVDTVARIRGSRTATYTALLDGSGELVGAIADMAIFDAIRPEGVETAAKNSTNVGLIICDANLQPETLQQVSIHSSAASVPAWFEPVSVAKAARGRCQQPWHLVSPNWDELLALLGRQPDPLASMPTAGTNGTNKSEEGLPDAVVAALDQAFQDRIAKHVLLTMGPRGIVLASAVADTKVTPSVPRTYALDAAKILMGIDGAPSNIPPLDLQVQPLSTPQGNQHLWYRLLRPLASVRDVTGAGDAVLAGAARAFTAGWPLEEAIVAGMFCAHVTLFVDGAVPSFMTSELFRRLSASMIERSSRL